MQPHNVLRALGLAVVALGAGGLVGASCATVDYPQVAFRCSPRQSQNCPEGYFCCSDDPSAVGGNLPDYEGRNIPNSSTPLFSGINNNLGTFGMCVETGSLDPGVGLMELAAANCPIPCNPTWSDSEIEDVCGMGSICCQTVELEPSDCVQDLDGTWRPVTGEDIANGLTDWRPGQHATHQGPGGRPCQDFAGNTSSDEYRNCVRNLTVANQRGFCLDGNNQCPTADPNYIDACEALNMGGGGTAGGGGTG